MLVHLFELSETSHYTQIYMLSFFVIEQKPFSASKNRFSLDLKKIKLSPARQPSPRCSTCIFVNPPGTGVSTADRMCVLTAIPWIVSRTIAPIAKPTNYKSVAKMGKWLVVAIAIVVDKKKKRHTGLRDSL